MRFEPYGSTFIHVGSSRSLERLCLTLIFVFAVYRVHRNHGKTQFVGTCAHGEHFNRIVAFKRVREKELGILFFRYLQRAETTSCAGKEAVFGFFKFYFLGLTTVYST